MKKEKVLIIKPGYSETLVNDIGTKTSLGDVLRSTVILPLYKDAHVTWLVDEKAVSLLKGNIYIDRIMTYDLTSILQLQKERFDTVINLEKVGGLCALADSINGWRRYGFRFDPEIGEIKAYDGSQHVVELCSNLDGKRSNQKLWEEFLFEMVGAKWDGEMPILGYKPKSKEIFDIGFNHNVGDKWPIKAWPKDYWEKLQQFIGGRFSVSWQQGLGSIEEYIEWISSCRFIITNDSLGLHIAHALDKKIIALFGPTVSGEVYVRKGIKLLPDPRPDCLPCMSNICKQGVSCMYDIRPERVLAEVNNLMSGGETSSGESDIQEKRGLIPSKPDFKGIGY
ncbi:MAG: glycosyltransferase family 9 protein [Parcubacteria group bacterium]|nr:glycosyltransferase family 9 protein [Parcubacteria group bacterium]MCR4342522.1 glycosyltransferase family 9 protein [Patescibacteria group bacterium]